MSIENDSKRILCVGMCVMDVIHVCEKFPVEDTDKRCQKGFMQRGGNASNNCTVLSLLGANCEFLGMLSDSTGFFYLKDDCHKRNIRIDNCPTVILDPPFSSIILNHETDSRTIVHFNPNFPILTYDHFKKINLKDYCWIHFEARNPNETKQMLKAINSFNKENPDSVIQTSLELEKVNTENLILTKYVDYIIIGKDLAIFLNLNSPQSTVYGLREIIENKTAGIVCTWGSIGCCCLNKNNELHEIKSYPPDKIVDSLGAGDTFLGAIIYALAIHKLSLHEAVDFGSRVAGFKLGHYGYDKIAEFQKCFS